MSAVVAAESVHVRAQRLIADARAILGEAAPPPGSPIGAYVAALAVLHGEDPAAHEAEIAALAARTDARLGAFRRSDEAVAQLRRITSPSAILAAAPAALCAASPLTRAVISSVDDGMLVAQAAHFDDDASGAASALTALAVSPVRLAHPLVETDVMRRRRAALVDDLARVDAEHARIMGWQAFVVAPVLVRGTVIALLHADAAGEPLDEFDVEILTAFATGVARAYESASLRRELRHEREQTREFVGWFDTRLAALASGTARLEADPAVVEPEHEPTPIAGGSDAMVFDGVLTRRELEVLRLLGEGRSNRAIADELVISTGTVKFHVNRILTKLHVHNRAEAVSRYYTLMGMRPTR